MPRLLAVCFLIGLAGCRPNPPESSSPQAPFAFDVSRLDAQRAFQEVAHLVALGPRDAGTDGGRRAAAYLQARLLEHGLTTELDAFEQPSPRGPTTFQNVIGRVPGTEPGLIILGSHYDTKAGLDKGFEGANDSGSSTGLLLEMARVMAIDGGREYVGPEIQVVFFDGEEALRHYGPHDGFHGSRHYAERLVADGVAARIRAVIVLDMVGDRDLTVTIPRNGTPSLVRAFLDAAAREGARSHFALLSASVGDDHEAFLARGMPAVDIIDFQYGSRPGRNDYWHTAEDRMDKISAESLGLVGRVTLRVLNELLASPHGM